MFDGAASLPESLDFWEAAEEGMASCLNREGRVSAQEVGISEHFEFAGTYRNEIRIEAQEGPLTLAVAVTIANGEVELKDRKSGARETLSIEAAINKLTSGG